MIAWDDFLYVAGLFWFFAMILYGAKKAIDYLFKKEK